jgi:hypothetical protein
MYENIPEGKTRSRGTDHPPIFRVEVKKRLELYVYSTSGPSLVVLW